MLIIGHRGCYFDGFNQNTIRSFREAVCRGAKAIEFDVQKTEDDALVIVHNLDLKDVSSGEGLVSDLPLSYVRSLHAGQLERGEDQIPLLDEVLAFASSYDILHRPCLHLELKGENTGQEAAKQVLHYIQSGRLRHQDLLVSSFIWSEISAFLKECPEVNIALLAGAAARKEILTKLPSIENKLHEIFTYDKEAYMLPKSGSLEESYALIDNVFTERHIQDSLKKEMTKLFDGSYYNDDLIEEAVSYKAVSLNLWFRSLHQNFIQKAHDRDIKILLYTLNDPQDIKYYTKLGIDGFFTDFYPSI